MTNTVNKREKVLQYIHRLINEIDTKIRNRTTRNWHEYYLELTSYIKKSIICESEHLGINMDNSKINPKKYVYLKSGYDTTLLSEFRLFVNSTNTYKSHCGIKHVFNTTNKLSKIMETLYLIVRTYEKSVKYIYIKKFIYMILLWIVGISVIFITYFIIIQLEIIEYIVPLVHSSEYILNHPNISKFYYAIINIIFTRLISVLWSKMVYKNIIIMGKQETTETFNFYFDIEIGYVMMVYMTMKLIDLQYEFFPSSGNDHIIPRFSLF